MYIKNLPGFLKFRASPDWKFNHFVYSTPKTEIECALSCKHMGDCYLAIHDGINVCYYYYDKNAMTAFTVRINPEINLIQG